MVFGCAPRGQLLDKLRAWPGSERLRVIVVTDGERILGLGDLGAVSGRRGARGQVTHCAVPGWRPGPPHRRLTPGQMSAAVSSSSCRQNGMGISEGKIELYTAAAGVDPGVCLPVALDVGTHNTHLRSDPRYTGLRQDRPPDEQYYAFTDEFMAALKVRGGTSVELCEHLAEHFPTLEFGVLTAASHVAE